MADYLDMRSTVIKQDMTAAIALLRYLFFSFSSNREK